MGVPRLERTVGIDGTTHCDSATGKCVMKNVAQLHASMVGFSSSLNGAVNGESSVLIGEAAVDKRAMRVTVLYSVACKRQVSIELDAR